MNFKLGPTSLLYQHGPLLPQSYTWTGASQTTVVTLAPLNGNSATDQATDNSLAKQLSATGPWSLFHVLDSLHVRPVTGSRNGIEIRLKQGKLNGAYLLTSEHAPNLFDRKNLRRFTLPASL